MDQRVPEDHRSHADGATASACHVAPPSHRPPPWEQGRCRTAPDSVSFATLGHVAISGRGPLDDGTEARLLDALEVLAGRGRRSGATVPRRP